MCLAVPGRVLSIEGDDPLARSARVDFSGVVRAVNLAFVPEARVDDYVLVHVGVALARIDEAEAARVLSALREIDALEEPEADPGASGEAAGGETSGPGDRGAGAPRAS
jgi:hydrogenase expression/formation protein HypC